MNFYRRTYCVVRDFIVGHRNPKLHGDKNTEFTERPSPLRQKYRRT